MRRGKGRKGNGFCCLFVVAFCFVVLLFCCCCCVIVVPVWQRVRGREGDDLGLVADGTEGDGHDGANKGEDHLGLDLDDVFGETEDGGSELAGKGDGILGVVCGLLIGNTGGDEGSVDGAGLDGVEEVKEEETVADGGVLEAGDRAASLDGAVGPVDHILVGDLTSGGGGETGEDRDDVETHHLPDEGESEGLVSVANIGSSNTDKRELEFLSNGDGIVCVFELLKLCEGLLLVDLLPVDGSGGNLVKDAEEDKTVLEIVKEVCDKGLNSERVDPEGKGTGLARTLRGKEPLLKRGEFLVGEGLETGVLVEEIGNKGEVELGVSLDDVTCGDELAAVELGGILEDGLGTLCGVVDLEGCARALAWGELVEEDGVALRVLDISGKVGDTTGVSGVLEVVVEPAEKDLIGGKLEEVRDILSRLKKTVKLWVMRQTDLGKKTNLFLLC